MRVPIALLALLLVPLVAAPSAELYTALDDAGMHQQMTYIFVNPYNQSFVHQFSIHVENITLDPAVPYAYINTTSAMAINITPNESISILKLTFDTSEAIFNNGEKRRFTFDPLLDPQFIRNVTITIALPAGFGTEAGLQFPENPVITSDGQRVVLQWPAMQPQDAGILSTEYWPAVDHRGMVPWLVGAIVVLLAAIAVLYLRSRRKAFLALLRGFREDERKAIEYLRTHGEVLQRDLQKDLGFSRAKSTRIVKKLERRGMVLKEERGRTNFLRWKG